MNENELKSLWQTATHKAELVLNINQKQLQDITKLKAQSLLSSMKPIKLFTLGVGILWVVLGGGFLGNLYFNHLNKVSWFFLISATLQVLITAIAIGVYVYQLDLMYKINFAESVFKIQQKLSVVKVSTLNVTRLLFLQLPLWTTFYWNESMFKPQNAGLWVLQGSITLALLIVALWLFFNIKLENRNKKWFRWIFAGKEWQPLMQAMALLEEAKTYQNATGERRSQ